MFHTWPLTFDILHTFAYLMSFPCQLLQSVVTFAYNNRTSYWSSVKLKIICRCLRLCFHCHHRKEPEGSVCRGAWPRFLHKWFLNHWAVSLFSLSPSFSLPLFICYELFLQTLVILQARINFASSFCIPPDFYKPSIFIGRIWLKREVFSTKPWLLIQSVSLSFYTRAVEDLT